MLFKLPPPFDDSFGCTQEWELNARTNEQVLRLDFMFRLSQPPSTQFGGVPYHCNLRSALSGGMDGQINRDVQRHYVVPHIFTENESQTIMHQIGFYQAVNHADEHWADFLNQVSVQEPPVAKIEVAELIDTLDQYPAASLSDSALQQLHQLRYQRRHRRFGKLFSKKF